MKSRLVPHGNRDFQKENIRKDSLTAQFAVILLLFSLITFLKCRLGHADVKGVYLQSGSIRRNIFVRPPKEWHGNRSLLLKLTKIPYGIVEAGRQWQKNFEEWLLRDVKVERIFGISQLYRLLNSDGHNILLVAKVTDDLLMAGTLSNMKYFTEQLKRRFHISKVILDEKRHFKVCSISQSKTGAILMNMQTFADTMQPIPLSRAIPKLDNDLATSAETTLYKDISGSLIWLGSCVLPQASFIASTMQQKLSCVKVCHIREADNMLKEILSLTPSILYRSPEEAVTRARVYTFSDSACNIGKSQCYSQTGTITGIYFGTTKLYHIID